MKFRYKVLMINLVLLSVSLGVVGYLMIHKNFQLALKTQLSNAIVENNLAQSSVEYELLQVLSDTNYHLGEELSEIGNRVAGSMLTGDSFFIHYNEEYVYMVEEEKPAVGDSLFDNLDIGGKNYVIYQEEGSYYIYVSSCSMVNQAYLHIVTKTDISDSYEMRNQQIGYFRFLIIGILLVASVIMYFVSVYLTKPLEQLTKVTEEIAKGEYDTRAVISSKDEVGKLAESFNLMAGAVSIHIEELNDMIRRRDQFVADFTHEIKTPMTTIIGYADTMRSMQLSREEEITSLNYIFSEGKRLEEMSHKLFELIYLKQHEIETHPIHVIDMGKEIEKIVTPALTKKEITFSMNLAPAVILGSRELLVTVFINLIDNARKASHPGSVVEFVGNYFPQEECYECLVIDHGIGMKEEDTKRICDEFYMVDKSRSRKEGGAGIGMSLVALILERHQADISIESKLGEGTTMRIRFGAKEENLMEEEVMHEEE